MKVILVVLIGLLFLLFFGSIVVRGVALLYRLLARISPGLAMIVTVLLSVSTVALAITAAVSFSSHGHHGHRHFV